MGLEEFIQKHLKIKSKYLNSDLKQYIICFKNVYQNVKLNFHEPLKFKFYILDIHSIFMERFLILL